MKIYDDINLTIAKLDIRDKTILDIGCGTGLLGEVLRKKPNYVIGINNSDEELKLAEKRLNECIKFDITSNNELNINRKVDVIIFADILEHTTNPKNILLKFYKFLNENGVVIISIPNISCYNVRINHLFGYFEYQEYGALDRTHLRFFTIREFKKLLIESNLKIIKLDYTPYFIRPLYRLYRNVNEKIKHNKTEIINQNILNSSLYIFYSNFIYSLENKLTKLYPSLFAYQFVAVCKI